MRRPVGNSKHNTKSTHSSHRGFNNKIISSKIRVKLWRWHRRMGLVSALFVILLASTGLLLNHGNDLGLDRRSLPTSFLSRFYQIEPPELLSYTAAGQHISQVDGRQLFIADRPVAECRGDLVGAIAIDETLLLACEQELLLLTATGELIDQLDPLSGMPLPLRALGICGREACWQSGQQSWAIDTDTMIWRETRQIITDVSTSSAVPPQLSRQLLSSYRSDITWERWLQDLHSGRLLGPVGPWLVDLMAILFVVIAATGVLMWSLGRKRKL